MDAHELLSRLKALALELGRTPSRDEFISYIPNGRNHVDRAFGSYAVMLEACGLESPKRGKKKLNDSIFEVNLEQHLKQHHETSQKYDIPQSKELWPKIAIMGDMHEPFSHAHVKQDFITYCRAQSVDYIVQIGDAFDAYAHSKFPRSHNVFTPKEEERIARKRLEEFWREAKKASPQAKCVQLIGNHDVRALKRVLEVAPSLEHWVEAYFKDLMSFDGVETILDPREEYAISGIEFIHGYRAQLGAHRDYMLHNICVGHTHRGGVAFRNIRGTTLWELNAGYAADPTSKGLSYTPQRTVEWTLGFGAIDVLGPRFIPFRK